MKWDTLVPGEREALFQVRCRRGCQTHHIKGLTAAHANSLLPASLAAMVSSNARQPHSDDDKGMLVDFPFLFWYERMEIPQLGPQWLSLCNSTLSPHFPGCCSDGLWSSLGQVL